MIVKNNCPVVYYYDDDKQNINQILDNTLGKYKNYTYDDYDNITTVSFGWNGWKPSVFTLPIS